MPIDSPFHFAKQAAEKKVITVDFTDRLLGGETLNSCTAVATQIVTDNEGVESVSTVTATVISGSVTVATPNASVTIHAGTAGVTYKVTFVGTTSAGNKREIDIFFTVISDPAMLATYVASSERLFEPEEFNVFCKRQFDAAAYNMANAFAKSFLRKCCNRNFVSRTVTERVSNRPARRHHTLKEADVTAIASIVTGFLNTATTTETIDPMNYEALDWGFDLVDARGCDFFTVTYTAGPIEGETEEDIKFAAKSLGKWLLLPEDKPSKVVSMSAGGSNLSFATADFAKGKFTGDDYVDSIITANRRGRIRMA